MDEVASCSAVSVGPPPAPCVRASDALELTLRRQDKSVATGRADSQRQEKSSPSPSPSPSTSPSGSSWESGVCNIREG
eukprot:CAMPEP_0194113826 /NCGR_PEP_ID=MMETSP0150-20130528/18020_1 /TAXON_ID=122233 /ORGANISM="Chaetoceros debilis, Strain MM31A-1" /LENGTH=77 /DNA_ID=CAMNT_0038803861 /DNA_START=68 /DNA_END=297 /DNA_ORIENTATION=+